MIRRFIVPKEQERAEVLAQKGVGGFQFKKGEMYVFKYSFKPKEGMKVSDSSTRFGQIKGIYNGFQLKGNPMYSLTANNDGINVRFSNDPDKTVEGMDSFLSWEDATGDWVDVEIVVTFGRSMEVSYSGVSATPSAVGVMFAMYRDVVHQMLFPSFESLPRSEYQTCFSANGGTV